MIRFSRTNLKLNYLNINMNNMSTATISNITAANTVKDQPIETEIRNKLQIKFLSAHIIEVINESYKHNVPKGSESHFKVLVVSDLFEGNNVTHYMPNLHEGNINSI